MPTTIAEPTLDELVRAFHDGVRATCDRYADGHEGAVYDHFAGVGAIHWSRQARRDTDLWRAIYFATADGGDLTDLLADRYGFVRVADTYGVGTATISRATAAAAGGTIWQGTRLVVYGPLLEAKRYIVTANTVVSATALTASLPLRAERPGKGTAISVGANAARIDEPLWDTTWTVNRLACEDGTEFEPAAAARARFRDVRLASRVGFIEALVSACKEVGVENAVLFPSDYGGDSEDQGLNMAYVGDSGYSGSDALVRAVQVRLEQTRVLGDNLQVRPLTRGDLIVRADVNLWDLPARVNTTALRTVLVGAILGYFDGATSGFSYDRDALAGAMMKATSAVQFVSFALPSADAGVLSTTNGRLNFPGSLSRYRVRDADITLTFLPPV
jgi:hypothetical protein